MKAKKKPVKKPEKVKPYSFTKEQKMWLKDLETTKAKQTDGCLTRIDEKQRVIGHCCLGRACVVFRQPIAEREGEYVFYKNFTTDKTELNPEEELLPSNLVSKLKLHSDSGKLSHAIDEHDYESLAEMNDSGSFTFKQIAKFIRKHPRAVFKD